MRKYIICFIMSIICMLIFFSSLILLCYFSSNHTQLTYLEVLICLILGIGGSGLGFCFAMGYDYYKPKNKDE